MTSSLRRELCALPSRAARRLAPWFPWHAREGPVVPPRLRVGSPAEYARWTARARLFLRQSGNDPGTLERVAATFNYASNRVLLFHLPDPRNELSIADTLAHEFLHSLLDQLGERAAARRLDGVAAPVGDPERRGGV